MLRQGSVTAKVDLTREEIEQLARMQAERLLAPRAVVNAPPPPPPRPRERSLEERLADIDRRWVEYARNEKAALVTDLLVEARKRFRAALSCTMDVAVRSTWDEVERAERLRA